MTKLKQFSNEFDVLYSRENNPWTGGTQGLTSSDTLCQRILGKSALKGSMWKQDTIGQQTLFLRGR